MRLLARFTFLICLAVAAAAQTPLTIVEDSLPGLRTGVQFEVQLHATGGAPPYLWFAEGELPAGITLSPSGLLSGRPVKTGKFTITVTLADSSTPHHAVQKELTATVSTALLLEWLEEPKVQANRIDGSVQVSNGSQETYDLTVVIVAVSSDSQEATAIGYEHFPLKPNTNNVPVRFGSTLPRGSYTVHADAVAEVTERNSILRQRLQTPQPLTVAVGP